MGSRLAALLDEATPGPWVHEGLGYGAISSLDPAAIEAFGHYAKAYGGALVCESAQLCDRRLIALAPDMARLLVDMADTLAKTIYDVPGYTGPRAWWADEAEALLARFAEIERRAAP